MAVTECKLAENFPYTMTTDHRGRSTYAMRWIIHTDTNMPNGLVAIGAQDTGSGFLNPLPARWSTYDHLGYTDPYAYFKGDLRLYKPNPKTKPSMWFVEGTYEPLEDGQTAADFNADPLLRPVRYRLESEPYSRVVTHDKDGNQITNAAGQEFTDRHEEEGFRDVLVATVNVADLSAITTLNNTYRYSVNTDVFHGAAARHARIDNIESSDLIIEGATSYYQAIIRVIFNHEPWDLELLNQGFMVRDIFGELIRAKDANGKETAEPVLLDASGRQLGGMVGNFREFRVRREVAYSGLGI